MKKDRQLKAIRFYCVLFALMSVILSPLLANSQTIQKIEVSGTVTDDVGNPLPGVTVALKGSQTATQTDVNGGYTLSVPSGSTLTYSFISFQTVEESIGSRQKVNIELSPSSSTLDEVVVIGYQEVRKKDLTGATSVIDPEASRKISGSSLAESIQGLAAGVTVRNSGNPGNGSQIEIRGAASFLNTSPLYVIDGMISDLGPIMNTNNIASIQILKDASAAAIYGSRAANGVVIITTKQGKQGVPTIQVSAKYGVAQLPKTYDMMNASEYASMVRTQYTNSGTTPPTSVGLDNSFIPAFDTDWQKEIIQTGAQQDYSLTASGGSESAKYLISGGYYDHKGTVIGNSFNRADVRINTELKRGKFTFGENFVVNHGRNRSSDQGNAFYDMVTMLPVIPVRDDSYISNVNPGGWGIGSPEAVTYSWNTLAVNDIVPFRSNTTKAVGNAYGKYSITDWLSYKFNAGIEARYVDNKLLVKEGIWRYTHQRGPTAIEQDKGNFTSFLFDHTLNFDKRIDKHAINGVVGYSSQETQMQQISARKTDLQIFDGKYMEEINSATGESSVTGSTSPHYRIQGFLGRVNYNFDDRYQLTLTGRYDQDSRFAAKYRSGLFPSIAGSWNIHNESFFDSSTISQLKLRGSYGQLGIVTVGSWDYIALLNSGQRAIFGPNQVPNVGANQAQLTNTDLRWEKRTMKNIGIDASLFNNRMEISAEWYSSVSDDALINQVLPGYLGNLGGNPPVNAGGISNKGIELTVSYKNNDNPIRWGISGNLTTIKNLVESVGDQGEGVNYIQSNYTRSQEGRSIAEWYVIRTGGLFQSAEQVQQHTNSNGKVIQPHAKPGDLILIDLNDDGIINQADRDFVGSPWPTLQTGLQFNASYKDFSLNAQFVGVFGNTLYNDVKRTLDGYQNSNFRKGISPWSPDNTNTSDPRIGVVTGDAGLVDNARVDTDRWLESGSYVRLRSLELGYSLPSIVSEKLKVRNARVFLNGQNLITLTGYSGADPDVTGNGIHQRGFDSGNWPSDRIYSLGLQFDF